MPMAGGTVLQVDQAALAHQALLRHFGKRRADANLDRHQRLRAGGIIKKRLRLDVSMHTLLQILSLTLFEKLPLKQAVAGVEPTTNNPAFHSQLNLFEF
jgi:hypothetical protein